MKKLVFVLALVLALCACAPSTPTETDTTTKFISEGYTLSVPNEYADLLIVDTTVTEGARSTFFNVHEKASVDAAKELWPDDDTMGGGFLFGIGRVDEAAFREMMIWGMTGADVFARDGEGGYYIYYHPTDVQLIRVGDYTDADWAQWAQLGQWAVQVKQTFIDDNSGLTPYQRTYSDVDCILHYVTYGDGVAHLHHNRSDAIYTPERSQSAPYTTRLLDDVLYLTVTDSKMAPSGDFITLRAPEMFSYASFDFFLDEGQQHIIRQNFHFLDDTQAEPTYYVASKNGDFFPAGKVVADWLAALS